jgi:hypothetical protein
MNNWINAVMVAAALTMMGMAAINPVAAANSKARVQAPAATTATDLNARRGVRHHRYQSYRTYYVDRPYAYRPYPYAVPVPFFLGFAFGPSW